MTLDLDQLVKVVEIVVPLAGFVWFLLERFRKGLKSDITEAIGIAVDPLKVQIAELAQKDAVIEVELDYLKDHPRYKNGSSH